MIKYNRSWGGSCFDPERQLYRETQRCVFQRGRRVLTQCGVTQKNRANKVRKKDEKSTLLFLLIQLTSPCLAWFTLQPCLYYMLAFVTVKTPSPSFPNMLSRCVPIFIILSLLLSSSPIPHPFYWSMMVQFSLRDRLSCMAKLTGLCFCISKSCHV